MSTITIPLDGKLTDVKRELIPLAEAYLDIQNPRIQYYLDARLNNDLTSEQVQMALIESNGQYPKLKENIEANGGIYNPIWVVPDERYYKIIEGNSRAMVYLELSQKYPNDDKWKTIDAYILPIAVERYKINFIRLEAHLFGTTPWDAYEKARELYRLYTEEDYSVQRLQRLTKLSGNDIRNNIQAFKDMNQQYLPKYGNPGEQLKFSYFVEFRKNKELRAMLHQQQLSLEQFCDLVGQGRLGRGEDVRRLSQVWADDSARAELINHGMQAALEQLALKNPGANSKLFERISEVIHGLEHIEFGEYSEMKLGLQPAKVQQLVRLHEVLSGLLADLGGAASG